MSQQQYQPRAAGQPSADQTRPTPKADAARDAYDAVLDEIDAVLEQDAEAFVKGFVQKGGQ